MRVLQKLDCDLAKYGYNQFILTDSPERFAVQRIHPRSSMVEINQLMDRENDYKG